MTTIAAFFREDPAVAVTLTLGLLALFVGCVWALLLAHEERKAERQQLDADRIWAQKRRYDAILQAQRESRENVTRFRRPTDAA